MRSLESQELYLDTTKCSVGGTSTADVPEIEVDSVDSVSNSLEDDSHKGSFPLTLEYSKDISSMIPV